MGFFGGGGGRLEVGTAAGPTGVEDPQRGYYFSWQMVDVDTQPDGSSRMAVRSIPVLESMALSAPEGTVATRGNAIHFTGTGRIPDVGHYDYQSGVDGAPMVYTPQRIGFPFGAAPGVQPPDYHFTSDDIAVIAPVQPDPAHPDRPLKDATGHTHLDVAGTAGLFCAFQPGTTTIRLTAGTVAAQLPVTVRAGSGTACGPLAPLPPPAPKPVVKAPVPVVQPAPPHPAAPGPAPVAIVPPQHVRPQTPQQAVGAVAPPPAEVVPAPPGGGVGQSAVQREKEEESEAATEDAKMTALRPSRGVLDDSWLPLGAAGLATGMAAYCIARGRRRRLRPVRAAVVTAGASSLRQGRGR